MRDPLKLPRSIAAWAALAGILLCGVPFLVATAGETNSTSAGASAEGNSLLLISWGLPEWTHGDAYAGPGPTWWRGGGKLNGAWIADGWRVESAADGLADLVMFLDRACLPGDLILTVHCEAGAPADLRVSLLDDRFEEIVPDIAGNVALAASLEPLRIPLAAHSAATAIRLRRHSGPLLVRSCLLTAADGGLTDPSRDSIPATTPQSAVAATSASGGSAATIAADTAPAPDRTTASTSPEGTPVQSAIRTPPAVIHVDSDLGDDARDGLSSVRGAGVRGPKRTIAAAIAAAADGDTIQAAGSAALCEGRWDLGNKRLTVTS